VLLRIGPDVAGDNGGVTGLLAAVESYREVIARGSVDRDEDGEFRVEPRQSNRPGHGAARDMEESRKPFIVSFEVQTRCFGLDTRGAG
jgi:hypothetical protein